MEMDERIILIDSDFRRRASISHSLADSGLHIEPFETVEELSAHWSAAGTILIHDSGTAVEDLVGITVERGAWRPVIAYAADASPARVVEAILVGAVDYLDWPFSLESLTASLKKVGERTHTIGNGRMRAAAARGQMARLTRREREVLENMASGLSNRLIGERLSISPRTVEIHRANMLNKIGAAHTSEAIRIAIEASLMG